MVFDGPQRTPGLLTDLEAMHIGPGPKKFLLTNTLTDSGHTPPNLPYDV